MTHPDKTDPMPQTAASGADRPPIDIPSALERTVGDRGLLAELLAVFLKLAEDQIPVMASALAQADAGALELAAHRLKGSAANLSAEGIRRLAERLETIGQQGAFADVERIMAQLHHEVNKLRTFAQHFDGAQAAARPGRKSP